MKNKPVYSIRLGAVEGAVFANANGDQTWYSTSIVNHYKDASGNFQTNHSFDQGQVCNLSKVSECCANFVVSRMRKVELS